MKRARKSRKKVAKTRRPGPLSALGWNRAHVHPHTGADLKGNWVYPNPPAVQHAAKVAQKKVFRDTQAGATSARRLGLL